MCSTRGVNSCQFLLLLIECRYIADHALHQTLHSIKRSELLHVSMQLRLYQHPFYRMGTVSTHLGVRGMIL